MDRVDWNRIEEKTFNDLIEALLIAEYHQGEKIAEVLSGRGGDGGIDVDVRDASDRKLRRIFQLKFFPGGFSGGFTARRRQIKKSLDTAIEKENPPAWTLVTPTNVTAGERKAVLAMRHGRTLRIDFFGPAQLDILLAKHPAIHDYFTRDRDLRLLKELNRQSAFLAKPNDLDSEVKLLQKKLDGRSAFWGTALTTAPDGSRTFTTYAKHPQAHEREPLSISFGLRFGEEDDQLKEKFTDIMTFGASEAVSLPGRIVEHFRTLGPEWFADEYTDTAELRIYSVNGLEEPLKLRVATIGAEGIELAATSGNLTSSYAGSGGISATVVLPGLKLHWKFRSDGEPEGAIKFVFDAIGQRASALRRTIRLLDSLSDATSLQLKQPNEDPVAVSLHGEAPPEEIAPLRQFVGDLVQLERHFDLDLEIPEGGFNDSDRVWARIMCNLLDGKPTSLYRHESLTVELSGVFDDAFARLLAGSAALGFEISNWSISLFGQELRLRNVRVYHPLLEADDSENVLEALREGKAAGRKVVFRGKENTPFTIYSEEFLAPDGIINAHPWGVLGVPEHPGLEHLPHRKR
ncbi:hypothetical protein EDF35_3972 [Rathayibacter sp. PhB151]|uniref:hypothetical protein n=1 Tax=Rathayibacter sp. PhB151 TaxID=2485189 RepID=UPI0010632395|nr:hypothetical protein [Rathayibacter sp. PhB151]TDX74479.1 hypothetical protein EDF35_3972 [Rathayibacter sp. PhB151]